MMKLFTINVSFIINLTMKNRNRISTKYHLYYKIKNCKVAQQFSLKNLKIKICVEICNLKIVVLK